MSWCKRATHKTAWNKKGVTDSVHDRGDSKGDIGVGFIDKNLTMKQANADFQLRWCT